MCVNRSAVKVNLTDEPYNSCNALKFGLASSITASNNAVFHIKETFLTTSDEFIIFGRFQNTDMIYYQSAFYQKLLETQ